MSSSLLPRIGAPLPAGPCPLRLPAAGSDPLSFRLRPLKLPACLCSLVLSVTGSCLLKLLAGPCPLVVCPLIPPTWPHPLGLPVGTCPFELPIAGFDLPARPHPLAGPRPLEFPTWPGTLELPAASPDPLPAEPCPLTRPCPPELPAGRCTLELPAAWPDLLPAEACPLTQPILLSSPLGQLFLTSLLLGLIYSLLSHVHSHSLVLLSSPLGPVLLSSLLLGLIPSLLSLERPESGYIYM